MDENYVDKLLKMYFHIGISYDEILCFLSMGHNIKISKSSLKKKLGRLGLFRRKHYSDLLDVALFIIEQIQESGQNHGYRWMHLKCIQSGYNIPRDTVYDLMCILDKEGVAQRKRRRLKRRQYASKGPNYVWHIDSYDKLKRFGIAINGCIDGFSRNIIWLEANTTNSDPRVISSYFTEAVKRMNGCPQRVRTDLGTENAYIEQMQTWLRRNHRDRLAGENSFLYGKSTHNQRIEWFWGLLRKEIGQFWMDFFNYFQIEENCMYSGDFVDKSLLQFCFMDIIQRDLDELRETWNTHRIATTGSRPFMLYTLPELFGGEECICQVDIHELEACEEVTSPKTNYTCDETIFQLCENLLEDNDMDMPNTASDCKALYVFLRRQITALV